MDSEKLALEVGACANVLVVEECRKTGSMSEFLVASLVEKYSESEALRHLKLPRIKVVAADDCFIPLGQAAAAGLPKKEEILQAAISLLGLHKKESAEASL